MSYARIMQYKKDGELKILAGDYDEAMKSYQLMLKESEDYPYPNEYDALNKKIMGVFLLALGQYETAEPYFKESLDILKNLLGQDNLRIAKSLTHLGLLYQLLDKFDQAESVYRKALSIESRTPYLKYPEVDIQLHYLTTHLLAMVYCVQKRQDEALELSQSASDKIKQSEILDGEDLYKTLHESIINHYDNPDVYKLLLHKLSHQLQKQYLGSVIHLSDQGRDATESLGDVLNPIFDVLSSFEDVWRPWVLKKEESTIPSKEIQPIGNKDMEKDMQSPSSSESMVDDWRP